MKELMLKKDKRNSFILSVILHIVLFIIFYFNGLKMIIPAPEHGMLINFGTDDQGYGEVQPEQTGEVQELVEEVVPIPETQQTDVDPNEEDVLTSNDPNPVEVPKEKVTQKQQQVVDKPKEIDPKLKETLNNAFNKSSKTSGGSEGNDPGKTGDKGEQWGVKDAGAYSGKGDGKGYSYSLNGRGPKAIPLPIDNSQEEGNVVVDIIVDRAGNVVSARPGGKGTTAPSSLYEKARVAAMKAKFTPNPDAPEQQSGQITYKFILQ